MPQRWFPWEIHRMPQWWLPWEIHRMPQWWLPWEVSSTQRSSQKKKDRRIWWQLEISFNWSPTIKKIYLCTLSTSLQVICQMMCFFQLQISVTIRIWLPHIKVMRNINVYRNSTTQVFYIINLLLKDTPINNRFIPAFR